MWLYKKKEDVAWCIIRKGGSTDGTYSAVQPNIDNRSMVQKNFITHAYPQLHISDCSTTQKKNKHWHPSTQTVQYGATDKTVSIDHLKQNAGTICTKHGKRLGETLMYCK